jgi:RND family efflux transporter MFP subunit
MRASDSSPSSGVLRVVSIVVRSAAGLLVLAVSVGIYWLLVSTAKTPTRAPLERIEVQVSTVPVATVPVPRVWEGYGTAAAMRTAEVSAQIAARVIDRPLSVEEGRSIGAGDVLVTLEQVDVQNRLLTDINTVAALESDLGGLEIELDSLNERLELGEDELGVEQRTLDRLTGALGQGAANATDVDRQLSVVRRLEREVALLRQQIRLIDTRRTTLQAQLEGARAALSIAEENLARATVRSPITGILQRVDADLGELLGVGSVVARVVDLRTIEVPVRLPVSSISTLSMGDRVTVRTDGPGMDGSGAQWVGKVVRVAPEADPSRRTITAFVEVTQALPTDGNLSGLLLPGQFVTARVQTASMQEYAIVPRPALRGDRVLALAENLQGETIARQIDVEVVFEFGGSYPEIHPRETQWAAVRAAEGTTLPDRVILSNFEGLRDGSAVRVQVSQTDPNADDGVDAEVGVQPGRDRGVSTQVSPETKSPSHGGA